MKKLAFFGLWLLLVTACSPTQPTEKVVEINYGETLDIPEEKIKLTFTAVNDSRCPRNTQCVTAGEANVTLTVDKGGTTASLELSAKGLCYEEDGTCGSEAEAMGYHFTLLSLKPYPEENTNPTQEVYVVKVRFSALQSK